MDDVAVWNRGLTQPELDALIAIGIDTAAAVEADRKLTTAWGAIKH
jgi:hypothetical protein